MSIKGIAMICRWIKYYICIGGISCCIIAADQKDETKQHKHIPPAVKVQKPKITLPSFALIKTSLCSWKAKLTAVTAAVITLCYGVHKVKHHRKRSKEPYNLEELKKHLTTLFSKHQYEVAFELIHTYKHSYNPDPVALQKVIDESLDAARFSQIVAQEKRH